MIIAFACDHGGFPFREDILNHLKKNGHEVIDFGPQSFGELDDFPDYAHPACEAIISGKAERGVLVCGTWIGMSIAANRHSWIRAVLAYTPEITKIARNSNDSNVICFGARTMEIDEVLKSLDVFFTETFKGGKYQRRNEKMDNVC